MRAQRHRIASLSPPASSARRPLPKPRDKHHSYLELVENKDRKKKLECEVCGRPVPFTKPAYILILRRQILSASDRIPPGYVFVRLGNPEFSSTCKELSRERDVKIYIVSVRQPLYRGGKRRPKAYSAQNWNRHNSDDSMANHMARMGYHFFDAIVREAMALLCLDPHSECMSGPVWDPEPIPEYEPEYHAQVDRILRDLFPRIPNTDRQEIINRAFTRVSASRESARHCIRLTRPPQRRYYKGEPPVGLSTENTLARRAQLAALAHIRHSHTRYDELLREMTWNDARKVVQPACCDVLVKWRGDEETGRDQLEEILREVVVISDSEDEGAAEDEYPDVLSKLAAAESRRRRYASTVHRRTASTATLQEGTAAMNASRPIAPGANGGPTAERIQRRGFKRYAAMQQAWDDALKRLCEGQPRPPPPPQDTAPRSEEQPTVSFCPGTRPRPPDTAPRSEEQPNVSRFGTGARDDPSRFDLRGGAPSSNGYVPRPADPAGRRPCAEVYDVAQVPPAGLHQAAPTVDGLQDMVVRSVEESGQYTSEQQPYGRAGLVGPGGFNLGPSSFQGRAQGAPPGPSAAAPPPWRRNEPWPSREHAVPDRIVVNTALPGSRVNPILMEDRGGFYERVATLPNPLERQVAGAPARHRVVSREEGSKILLESQGTPGLEVIPISLPANISHTSFFFSDSSATKFGPVSARASFVHGAARPEGSLAMSQNPYSGGSVSSCCARRKRNNELTMSGSGPTLRIRAIPSRDPAEGDGHDLLDSEAPAWDLRLISAGMQGWGGFFFLNFFSFDTRP